MVPFLACLFFWKGMSGDKDGTGSKITEVLEHSQAPSWWSGLL